MTTLSIRNSISRPPLRRGLPRKQPRKRSGPRTQAMWIIRGFLLIPLALVLAWLALSPTARAVTPAPDGGYPYENTAEGTDALFSLIGGWVGNTAIGFDALYFNTTASYNTATGDYALYHNTTGDNNTANSVYALYFNTTGFDNTANGREALLSNTTGNNNTANGYSALIHNTTGNNNTANGVNALFKDTTGNSNTANGANALYFNTTGNFNTATGRGALYKNTASNNTANGYQSLNNNTIGAGNLASGYQALFTNTTGSYNMAVGYEALYSNTTGTNNIALGWIAGFNLTTGSNNIDIGHVGAAGESATIRLGATGSQTNTYIAGINGVTVAGGVGVIIDTNGHLGTVVSSARYKENIQAMDKASEAILALKPVTFHYKKELDPDGIPQFGLVAEEVAQLNPDLVVRDADGKVNTVRYEAVNAMLLNEFLKEHRTVQELKSTAAKQEAIITKQQKQIEALTTGLQKVSDQLELSKPAPRTVVNNQ